MSGAYQCSCKINLVAITNVLRVLYTIQALVSAISWTSLQWSFIVMYKFWNLLKSQLPTLARTKHCKKYHPKQPQRRAVVVAQLVDTRHQTSAVRIQSLAKTLYYPYRYWKDKNKEKEAGNGTFKTTTMNVVRYSFWIRLCWPLLNARVRIPSTPSTNTLFHKLIGPIFHNSIDK